MYINVVVVSVVIAIVMSSTYGDWSYVVYQIILCWGTYIRLFVRTSGEPHISCGSLSFLLTCTNLLLVHIFVSTS